MGSLFSFISNPFESWIGSLGLLVGSAGIAIILFTIGIRLILSPLQITQLRSARAMQRLQPKIQELRKKHGKDRQKLTEETMALYKEHKVNPAMGCLPMLLQFPVLIGLFWALQGLGHSPLITVVTKTWLTRFRSCFPANATVGHVYSVTYQCWDHINKLTVFPQASTIPASKTHVVTVLQNAKSGWTATGISATNWMQVHTPKGTGWILDRSYSWLTDKYHSSLWGASNVHRVFDLFHADFLWLSHGLGQPDPLIILPFLAGITQWIQSRMMMQRSSDPQQQSMNTLMNFTPLIIIFFAWHYPSGLSLYWVTSTVIGILISMRITGWGTLPRIDRWITGSGPLFDPAPGKAPPKRPSSGSSNRVKKTPDNGKSDLDADIVEGDGNYPEDGTGDANALPRPGSRPRQRTTRRRGGRRG